MRYTVSDFSVKMRLGVSNLKTPKAKVARGREVSRCLKDYYGSPPSILAMMDDATIYSFSNTFFSLRRVK